MIRFPGYMPVLVHQTRLLTPAKGAETDEFHAQSRRTDLGMRLLAVTDLFFRPLFAFVIIELTSRRVIHAGVTRSPIDLWVA
jgi:hypothetical protein